MSVADPNGLQTCKAFLEMSLLQPFWLSSAYLCHAQVRGSEDGTYEIVVEGEGNEMVVSAEPEDAQFEVFSERGLGSAMIEVTYGDFPESVELGFHLQGLEELRFGYDSAEVTVSVSSSDNAVYQYVTHESINSDPTTPVNADSPYWMEVKIDDPDESLGTTSERKGPISVLLPDDFVSGDYSSFRINRIDFFR